MSRTVYTTVSFMDTQALSLAVRSMGGQVIGHGTHHLYASEEQGFGVKLPGWYYPLVVKPNGQFAYDDYHGQWGDVKLIPKLEAAYRIEAAAAAAAAQGWQSERVDNKLVIYHPSGGTVTVTPDGVIDAECFTGSECGTSTDIIASAIGKVEWSETKNAYYQEKAKVVEHE